MKQLNAILTIAYRDVIKLLRDRMRLIAGLIFPIIFIGALGGSLQANLGARAGFNFLTFVFTGVLGQTLFQSTASGIISLIEDRENDFSQEIFVSPVSRYIIILGKILGESLVAMINSFGVLLFGLIVGVRFDLFQIFALIPIALVACLLGGGFGVLVLSQLGSQRSANQIFPFIIFPQFFLSGAFSPVQHLPWYLLIFSRIAPMTYAVDFTRGLLYWGKPDYHHVVIYPPLVDLTIIATIFTIMLLVGTYFFVKNERNK